MLLGFFQIQKVLVFQLHGFCEFLKNYSAEVIYFGKVKEKYSFLHFFPKKYSFVPFVSYSFSKKYSFEFYSFGEKVLVLVTRFFNE